MNKTILILERKEEIDNNSLQYLWAASYAPDDFRVVRVKDLESAQTLVKNMDIDVNFNVLPVFIYDSKAFTNLESIGSTISRDLRILLSNDVIKILKEDSKKYYYDTDEITLKENIIQESGGAIYDDKSKVTISDDNEIFMKVWNVNNKEYISINIKDIKDDSI